MAFWGVEIKPGKPFTHTYDDSKGRLHISMATLGHGTAITKSTLQCNVGNKSPVYLCSLYPGKTESLQLNLELEEDGNVILSVIGPRSIHLCGYYLARGRYTNTLDESESYGEDIADTEAEESVHGDEDDYDDSFIDDDTDLPVFPPSPIFNEEEAYYDRGRKSAKGSRKRLRKKYQLVESDDDGGLEEKKIVNDSKHVQSQEIDDEDSLPISSFCKNKASGGVLDLDQEMDDIVDKEAVDTGKKYGEDPENSTIETKLKIDNVVAGSQTLRQAEPSDPLAVPCTVLDVGDVKKSKKKKKGKEEETKSSFNDHSTVHDNAAQDDKNMDRAQDLLDQEMTDNVDKEAVDAGKKDGEDHENITIETKLKTDNVVADIQIHREAETSDPLAVPCADPDVGDIQKLNNNKKGKEEETKSSCNDHSTVQDNAAPDEKNLNTAQDLLDQEMADNVDEEAVDAGKKDGEDHENSSILTKLKTDNVVADIQTHREAEPSDPLAVTCTVPDVGDIKKSKKNKKGKEKETKSSCIGHSTELNNAAQDEQKMNMSQDLLDQEMADNVDKEAVDAGKNDGEDHENSTIEAKLKTDNVVPDIQIHREAKRSDRMVVLCTVPDVGYFLRSTTKTKGKADETKSSCIDQSTVQDNAALDEKNMNTTQDLLNQEMADNVDKEAVDAGKKHGEEHGNITIETKLKTDNVVADIQTLRDAKPSDPMEVPCTVPDVGDIKKLKKNKKGKDKKTKSSCNDLLTQLNNAAQDEQKMNMSQDQEMADNVDKEAVDPGINELHQQRMDDKKVGTADKILPSSQVGQGQDGKRKRKRKEQSKEETLLTTDDACISNTVNPPEGKEHNNQDIVNGDVKISHIIALASSETDSRKKTKRKKKDHTNKTSHPEGDNGGGIIQDEKANKETADSLIHKLSKTKEHQKLTIENSLNNVAQDNPDGNQSEDKKVKKKMKKSKSKGQGSEVVNSDMPLSSVEPNHEMIKEDGNNMEDTNSSQVRTLSNGLVIQELEKGKEKGKIAALGKKISINYTGKLKENGVEVESNAGQAPFKFRLGKGEVIEGLDIGLEGMRVGEKRRLVIPPSMTSKKNGDIENIPPNSWLVYDLELVKVH